MDIGLRPALPHDREFLLSVYAAARQDDLARLAWDAATKDAFLRSQGEAQDLDYRNRYPDASFSVVTVAGHDAGRVYRVELAGGELRLMDIALLPSWRGRGIGTRLIRDLIDEARRRKLLLSLHVDRLNPASRLYERLGFVVAAQDDVTVRMESRPG